MSHRKSGAKRFLRCDPCSQSYFLPHGSIAPFDYKCPICSFQILEVTNQKTHKSHKVCPFCYNNPPVNDLEDLGQVVSGFRCFQCSEPRCQFASKTNSKKVLPCGLCDSAMSIRSSTRNNKKSYFLGCTAYPRCRFAMYITGAKSVEPTDQKCGRCSRRDQPAYKLKLSFNRGDAPPHLSAMPEVIGCIRCSDDLNDVVSSRGGAMSARNNSKGYQTNANSRKRSAPVSLVADTGRKRNYPRLDLNSGGDRIPNHSRTVVTDDWGGDWGGPPGNAATSQAKGSRGNGNKGRKGGGWQKKGKKNWGAKKKGKYNYRAKGRTGGQASMKCFKCNQPGHFANACPNR